MKKNIIALLFVVAMLPTLVCFAYANEGYAILPEQSLPRLFVSMLKNEKSLALLDHNPTSGTVEYVSWVSYDYLSELSTRWDTAGVVVFNTAMQAYFIRVSYVPTVQVSGGGMYKYTVTSDCSISFAKLSMVNMLTWEITTSGTSSIVGEIDTPTVTITANPSTSTPVTISRITLASGSSDWLAVDTEGNVYSFDPVSNLALNRSFVVKTYTADEVEALDNFPSGYWTVTWTGESQYITIKFEEYSKFFLWLNRFLINFRDTLYTKMEDITVTAAGDLVLNTKDYTTQLNEINATLSNLSLSGEVNTDLTPVITSVDAVGLNIESLNANFNTNIGSLLDKLDIVIEGSSESLEERINVTCLLYTSDAADE